MALQPTPKLIVTTTNLDLVKATTHSYQNPQRSKGTTTSINSPPLISTIIVVSRLKVLTSNCISQLLYFIGLPGESRDEAWLMITSKCLRIRYGTYFNECTDAPLFKISQRSRRFGRVCSGDIAGDLLLIFQR